MTSEKYAEEDGENKENKSIFNTVAQWIKLGHTNASSPEIVSSSTKKKKVTFCKLPEIVLVPTRIELREEELIEDIWWDAEELQFFNMDAQGEVQAFIETLDGSMTRLEATKLYFHNFCDEIALQNMKQNSKEEYVSLGVISKQTSIKKTSSKKRSTRRAGTSSKWGFLSGTFTFMFPNYHRDRPKPRKRIAA